MRCPDCNKFVSYDTEVDPEESVEPEIADGEFKATYTRTLTCGECGTELKSAEIEVTQALEGIDDKCEEDESGEHEWEIHVDASSTSELKTTDRNGKPIKKTRYMKQLYGVEVSGTARCIHCGDEVEIQASGSEQASAFDEMV